MGIIYENFEKIVYNYHQKPPILKLRCVKGIIKGGKIMTTVFGTQHKCPNCGFYNPSGLQLPKECIRCAGSYIPDYLKKIYKETKDLDPKFSKMVDKYFWDLI